MLYRATIGRAVMLFSEIIAFVIEVVVRYACFFVWLPFRVAFKWTASRIGRGIERAKCAHRKRMRRRYTEAELRRVSQNACGMIPDEMPKKRTLKGRGRLVGRKSKKKAVQSDLAGARADRRFGGGIHRGVRKQSDEI